MKNKLTIGSRGSELALYQSNFIRDKIRSNYPEIEINIEIIKTRGDEISDKPLSQIGDKGLFTKALEDTLLNGSIDLAVHSLKDLQTTLPDEIILGAVTSEENPSDVFVSNKYNSIDELPEGATVATGSLRRKSQLLSYRNDLKIVDVRGNIDTRLKKLDENNCDGMIMAFAGLNRLGLNDKIKQVIPFEIMLPAVAQGVLGVEVNENNKEILEIIKTLDEKKARIRVTAERSFLKELEGGCQIPIAAYCNVVDDKIILEGLVGSSDGKIILREKLISKAGKAEESGKELAEMLKKKGATKIIDDVRNVE